MNTSAFNSAQYNAQQGASARAASADRAAGMFIVDTAGAKLIAVDYYKNGQWSQKQSQPSTISFEVPMDDDVAQSGYVAAPNQIMLVDAAGVPVDRFYITKRRRRQDKGGAVMAIEGVGLLSRLEREYTGTYLASTTIAAHLTAWLSAQTGNNPFTLGYIDPIIGAISMPWSANNKSILGEIHRVQKIAGGHVFVDAYGRLHWTRPNAAAAVLVYHMRENVESYEEEVDYEQIYNRVIATGGVNGGGQIRLAAPYYVEDAASVATYGPKTMKIQDITIKDQTTLTLWANAVLNRVKNGITTEKIGTLDLSHLETNPANAHVPFDTAFYIGAPLKVVKPQSVGGATVSTTVVAIDRSLDNPLLGAFDVGERMEDRDLYDEIADMRKDVDDTALEVPPIIETETIDEFTELNDAPNAYTGHGNKAVGVNSGATGLEFWIKALINLIDFPSSYSGAGGKRLQVNSGATAVEFIANTLLGLTDFPANYSGAAGKGLAVNGAGNAVEFVTRSTIVVSTTLAGLGAPADAAFGEVTADGNNTGLWFFPDGGSSNADWRRLTEVIVAASLTDLGNPGRITKGYVPTSGAEQGWWNYPPGGSSNGDWVPENVYSEAT